MAIHIQHPQGCQEWGSLCFCFLRSLNKHCSGTCLFSSYQHQKPIFIASYILSPAPCWQVFSHPLPALEIPAAVMGSSCELFNWKEFLSGLKMSGGWRRRVSIKLGLIYSAIVTIWITKNPSDSLASSSHHFQGGSLIKVHLSGCGCWRPLRFSCQLSLCSSACKVLLLPFHVACPLACCATSISDSHQFETEPWWPCWPLLIHLPAWLIIMASVGNDGLRQRKDIMMFWLG